MTQIIAAFDATSSDIDERLSRAASRPTHPVRKKDQYRLRHEAEVSDKALQTPPTDVPGALGPPLPLSQIKDQNRVVPHLVVTSVGNIPLLRYKIGRKPPWLRRIITQKIKWDMRSSEESERLEEDRAIAHFEDQWDAIVYRQARQEGLAITESYSVQRSDSEPPSTTTTPAAAEFLEAPPFVGPDSYVYWPQQMRQANFDAFEQRKWEYAVRGWQLWQKVKRERWLSERETIPARLLQVVRVAQRMQGQLEGLAKKGSKGEVGCSRRTAEEYEELVADLKALGPLHVPVEWSEKVVDREWPRYLKDGARRRATGERLSGYPL